MILSSGKKISEVMHGVFSIFEYLQQLLNSSMNFDITVHCLIREKKTMLNAYT